MLVVRCSAGCAAAACTALWAGFATPVLVVAAAAAAGAGEGGCRPAFQTLVADLVPASSRRRANAAITLAVRVTVLAGPALAAIGAAAFGARELLAAPPILWLLAAVVPAGSHGAGPSGVRAGATGSGRRMPRALIADYAEGLREARRHPWFLAGLGALTAVIALGYSTTGVALPLISREQTGGARLLTVCVTAYTAGALVGALAAARWRPRAEGWSALAGLAAYALAPAALWLQAPVAACAAAYLLVGIGIEWFNVPWFTATQREIAPDKLGRVSAMDLLAAYGLAPVGLAFMAPAIATFGLGPTLAGATAVCLAAPLAASAVPGARHFGAPPARAQPTRR